MAGEPTNPPRIPPTNDAGSGKPPPFMPPPPSSLPNLPEPDNDRMMREFVEAQKQIKGLLEELKRVTSKEVYDASAKKVIEATHERVEADKKHSEDLENLNKQYQEFMEVLEDGSIVWKKNTEFIQIEYQDKKADLDAIRKKKEDAEAEAKDKLGKLDIQIYDLRSKLSEMHRQAFRSSKEMERSNHPLKEDAEKEYESLVKTLEKANIETTNLVDETRRLALVSKRLIQLEAMALKQKKEFSELDSIRHKELIELYEKLGTEATAANAERIKVLLGEVKGTTPTGIFNAREIGKHLDEFLEEQRKILEKAHPEKSENEIAELLRQLIRDGKHTADLEARVKEKYDDEMRDLMEREVESVMREEKVSRQLATLIVNDRKKNKKTEFGREFHDLLVTQRKSLATIKKMETTDTLALAASNERDRRNLEIIAETKADTRLDQILLVVQKGFFDIKGLLFPKDNSSGWFKWILRALLVAGVFAATAYIGFIWYKVKFIGSMLGRIFGLLPRLSSVLDWRIVNFFKRIGDMITKVRSAVSGPIGMMMKILTPIGNVLMRVIGWMGTIFGFLTRGTGILSVLMRTIGIAWRFVGKLGPIFMAISIIIDAVRGAIRGYERFGGLKGIVIGIVAGLVDWLTFGFIGLDNILEGFASLGRGVMAVFEGIIKVGAGIVKLIFFLQYTLPNKIGEFIFSLAQKTADLIAEGLVAIWDMIQEPLMKLGEMLYAIPGMYVDFVVSQFKALGSIVSNISEWIMGVLSSGADMLSDAFSTLWNWISGGAILGGLKDLGTYLWDQISGMVVGWWDGIVGGIKKLMIRIGDALGKIPIIGSSLKKFFHGAGGGSDGGASTEMTGSASSLNRAVKSANSMVEDTNRMTGSIRNIRRETSKLTLETERTAMADRITRGASKLPTSNERLDGRDIQRANGNAENARLRATSSSQPIIINSPKTNVVNSGGDSGGGTVLMPAWSRNNDPTNSSMNMGNQPPA